MKADRSFGWPTCGRAAFGPVAKDRRKSKSFSTGLWTCSASGKQGGCRIRLKKEKTRILTVCRKLNTEMLGEVETMASFGMSKLELIVDLAGRELEREDRYIAGSFARNPAYSAPGDKWFPGILHLDDEKYYQRVTARALLASFPLRVQLEEQAERDNNEHFDLVLYSGDTRERVAVGEIKRCMHAGDIENDANPVRKDVAKLKRLAPATCSQFMVLFALNPRDPQRNTDNWWIPALRKQVPLGPDIQLTSYLFPTEAHWPNQPSEHEFGVIGLLLKCPTA